MSTIGGGCPGRWAGDLRLFSQSRNSDSREAAGTGEVEKFQGGGRRRTSGPRISAYWFAVIRFLSARRKSRIMRKTDDSRETPVSKPIWAGGSPGSSQQPLVPSHLGREAIRS